MLLGRNWAISGSDQRGHWLTVQPGRFCLRKLPFHNRSLRESRMYPTTITPIQNISFVDYYKRKFSSIFTVLLYYINHCVKMSFELNMSEKINIEWLSEQFTCRSSAKSNEPASFILTVKSLRLTVSNSPIAFVPRLMYSL